jgi:hypothetical protein
VTSDETITIVVEVGGAGTWRRVRGWREGGKKRAKKP